MFGEDEDNLFDGNSSEKENENTVSVQQTGNGTNSFGKYKKPQKDNEVDEDEDNLFDENSNSNKENENKNTGSVQQNGNGTNSFGKNKKPQKDNEVDTNGCVNTNQIGIIENTPITRVHKSPFR